MRIIYEADTREKLNELSKIINRLSDSMISDTIRIRHTGDKPIIYLEPPVSNIVFDMGFMGVRIDFTGLLIVEYKDYIVKAKMDNTKHFVLDRVTPCDLE